MGYRRTGSSGARACWRDGRGALRCRRGIGDADPTIATLPGDPGKSRVAPDIFLIANLNRFKSDAVPAGQSLGTEPFDTRGGITGSVAFDALTVVIRRLTSSLEGLQDEGAAVLLAGARAVLIAGDATGVGGAVDYVKKNVVAIGQQVAAYADSLGLPPAALPLFAGLPFSSTQMMLAAGGIGLAFLLFRKRR